MSEKEWKKEQKETDEAVRKTLSVCPICKLPPSTELSAYRGMGMIQAGMNFEFNDDLKSSDYGDTNNHIFADALVPLNKKLKNPLVFWLDKTFPSGVDYSLHQRPQKHFVLRIGPDYNFRSLLTAVRKAMKEEGVDLPDWFNKRFKDRY